MNLWGLEKRAIHFFLLPIRYADANHQAVFSPWRAIAWFNTMTIGKRRQPANRVQSQLNYSPLITPIVLKKMTAASQNNVQSTIELGRARVDDASLVQQHKKGGGKRKRNHACSVTA